MKPATIIYAITMAVASVQAAAIQPRSTECSPAYGQCGGKQWTGAKCCVKGYTCVPQKDNVYYSQCLPAASASGHVSTTAKHKTTKHATKTHTTSAAKPKTTTHASTTTSSAPTSVPTVPGGASGTGKTTRYFDCAKPSCSWPGKASVTSPVGSCAKDGVTLLDANTQNSAVGGTAYTCNSNQPWAVNDNLAYGFAAANIAGSSESGWCCACYELTFTSGAVAGKKMIVQATNTGGDLGSNQFDLQIPGGGVGIFNACQSQWGTPADGWGSRYGGVSSVSECSQLPKALQPGCEWRFNWFKNADNPTVTFREVTCPSALTKKTGCVRK